ncbi:endonuclease 8-like 3 isoform X2 [Scleropages formosus]|uniref:endonuclease 8-like 3 isoform X2 n=1 Tax=Scleropages formosus TaxID=113540 RepID=UPI0010FABF4C|nr:endonuclease 8-like 3 isoform X2 [Scleropages formosus]
MVEGPGCALNGEKIVGRVRTGQEVLQVTGHATRNEGSSFSILTGSRYVGTETLGKELFIYFGPRALRVHFGMNGSMRINPADQMDGSGKLAALEIRLTNDVICFFDAAVEIRLRDDCEQKVRNMQTLDICSPKFSFSRAEEAVKKEGARMLCDVLMDQAVLPGVGNIIKNEALFNSGLHPALKVSQLTDGQISHLVKMTRDFTLLFYKCRKSGAPLYKHFKVYKQPNCGRCSGKITVCRLGENGRMTYFCSNCQSGDPSQVNVSKVPRGSGLGGWLSKEASGHRAGAEEEEWACTLCTLVNGASARSCEACLSPRSEAGIPPATVPKEEAKEDFSSSSRHLIKYPYNAFAKPREAQRVNRKAVFGTSTLVFTDFSDAAPLASAPLASQSARLNSLASGSMNKQSVSRGESSPKFLAGSSCKRSSDFSGGESMAPCSQMHKKMRIDHGPFCGNKPQSGSCTFAVSPCCAVHRRPCALRVVRKEGDNKGRQFYACSLPQETRCDFFKWADLYFPTCKHGKRCLMRTVLKLGPNNGRNFYVCPLGMGRQCDFFQWADTHSI